MVLGELFRTVVGTVEFGKVLVGEVVGGTECPVLAVVGELTTPGAFGAVEHGHCSYVVQTELASVLQLELVEHVALSCVVVDFAAVGVELKVGYEVEVVVAVALLVILYFAGVGIDPFVLYGGVVADTAFVFNEYVVPRYECAGLKTLGDEREILLKGEVGVDTGGGELTLTCFGESDNGVRSALGVGRVVTPGTVAVAGKEHVGRSRVCGLPELSFKPRVHLGSERAFALSVRTGEVDLQQCGRSNLEVEV